MLGKPRTKDSDRQPLKQAKWMVRLLKHTKFPGKAINRMGPDPRCHPSATSPQTGTLKDNMDSPRAEWSTRKGTDRWATTATIPIPPMLNRVRSTNNVNIKAFDPAAMLSGL